MTWSKIGRWTLFLGSLAIGVLAGLGGYWIFEAKVPAAMQTSVLAFEAKLYYIGSGVGLGVVIFLWTMIGVAIARRAAISKARRDAVTAKPPGPGPAGAA